MGKENRKRCEYPMSKFYTYMNEVPFGVRVSTPVDCTECEKGISDTCDVSHCLKCTTLDGKEI